jgi:hypothetical protein
MSIFERFWRRHPLSPVKLIDETERLRYAGRSAEGLRLVESAAGIDLADYAEPARALQKINQWVASMDSRAAYLVLGRWLTLLADTPGSERLSLVARLWELDAGLCPEDYSNPERIRARIRRRIAHAGLDPRFSIFHAGRLAGALGIAGRTLEEIAVLEAFFSLHREDYSDPLRLSRALRIQPEGNFPDFRALCVPLLAGALSKLGRRAESTAVLLAALDLTDRDFSEPETILAKVREATGNPNLAVGLLLLLPIAVREAGGGAAGLTALEMYLDPDPERYRYVPSLTVRLRERLRDLPPDVAYFYLQSLVVGLTDEGRINNALSLLAADAGLTSTKGLANSAELIAYLKKRCRVLPVDVGTFYIWLVAYVLVLAGHPLIAAAVIEVDTSLQAVDWNDSAALAKSLGARFSGLSVISPLFLVDQLASALMEGGKTDRAALLVDAYVRVLSPAGGADEEISLVRWRCQMYTRWLFWWGQDEGRHPMEICQALLPYLRRSIAGRGMTLEDRESFIREIGELRRGIVQTGLYWAARETNLIRAKDLRQMVFLWDLELAQRLLVERFLLSEIRAVPAGAPPESGVWPMPSVEEPATPGYLPDAGETAEVVGVLEKLAANPD